MTDLLRAEGVSAFYGASQILFDIDVALQESCTLALLGRNGAGKSTTLKMLAGIVPARAGVGAAEHLALVPGPRLPARARGHQVDELVE